jgi:protein O-GlcNAc transferase
MPLEGVPPDKWLVFERALIVRDIYTGGGRTFLTTDDAQEFRKLVYSQYGKSWTSPFSACFG